MQLHVFPVEEITVPKNRQRKFFDENAIQELAASIADNGLIHPCVVRKDDEGELVLVAGERRLRALDIVWGYGQEVRCGEKIIPERSVPCLFLGEIDPVDAFEMELEENIRRTDLDWKTRASAVSQLYELRRLQAERDGNSAPTVSTIAEEVAGTSEGQFRENVRQDLILARHLDNPVVAKAGSRKEAFKALKRDEETRRHAALGRAMGETFSSAMHTLKQGDCFKVMQELAPESFDILLTDPPFGIGADEFGDSAGKTAGGHPYRDGAEEWFEMMQHFAPLMTSLMKPEAHAYIFCDIEHFYQLKIWLKASGWKVFRTPLIWINPSAMRAPWPEQGPQRKWQMVLYANRGDRPVTRLYSDVLTYASDDNLGHQAQKPVALYSDLLRRSVKPGNRVLDCFAGTGVIFPAAHQFQCYATGIEIDEAAVGIASKRLKDLV